MGYKNKCLLKIKDKTLLERTIDKLKSLFSEILVVAKGEEGYEKIECKLVHDIFPYRSSLTGIHTGLIHSSSPHSFIMACDMPLLKTEVISFLVSQTMEDIDVVIPKIGKFYEPLCAIYSHRCIPVIEEFLKKRIFTIREIFNHVRVREITQQQIQQYDPDLISFFNVNTKKDYERLLKIYLHLF